jgi:hypothetical protein
MGTGKGRGGLRCVLFFILHSLFASGNSSSDLVMRRKVELTLTLPLFSMLFRRSGPPHAAAASPPPARWLNSATKSSSASKCTS